MKTFRMLVGILLAALLLTVAACSSPSAPVKETKTPGARSLVGTDEAVSASPLVNKAFVLVIENKDYVQMYNSTNAPFIYKMSNDYSRATNFRAYGHPSQPNYAVMAFGSTNGITNNDYKRVSGPSVFGNSIKAGRSAKVVADGMYSDRCRHTNGGNSYVFRHNPWQFVRDENTLCEKYDFDLKYLEGDILNSRLANVEFLIPNNCNNSHNCPIRTADAWFKKWIDKLMAGPDYQSGQLAIIITADENDGRAGNRILTTIIHPSLAGKGPVSAEMNLYSLHRFLAKVGHTAPLRRGAEVGYYKNDMETAFGLTIN